MTDYFASYKAIRAALFANHFANFTSAPEEDGSRHTCPCSIFNEAWLLTAPGWSAGDNPLMTTGLWLIVLAGEYDLGNTAAARTVQSALAAVGDLFKFQGDHFDGYPLRRDPMISSTWLRAQSNGTPVEYSASFLVTDDYAGYEYTTDPNDWRSIRTPTHREWATWPEAQKNDWFWTYWVWDKFYRDWEPSQDEMIGLVAGLATVQRLMPGPCADLAKEMLGKIADYLAEHSYFLARPGGGFVNRGPAVAGVALEYAYNVCFESVLGDPHVSRQSTEDVLKAAGVWPAVADSWNAWGTAGFAVDLLFGGAAPVIASWCAPLGFIGELAAGVLIRAEPVLLGQAFGLAQVSDAFAVEMKADGGKYNDNEMNEIPFAHALRSIDPPARLAAYFTQASLATSGYSVSFLPYALLLTVDDQFRPLQPPISDWYARFLETRLSVHGAGAFPAWGNGLRQGGLFLGAGLAVLGASWLEATFKSYVDEALRWFPGDHLPTSSGKSVPNPHDEKPVPGGTWEDGNGALDLLAGMVLAWQHEKRHGGTIAGFPPPPDMSTLDTPIVAPKPAVPAPQCPPRIWVEAGDNKLPVPADGTVVDTGLDVLPWDRISVESAGQVTLGNGGVAGPAGTGDPIWDRTYPYWGENARAGQVLARLGPYGAYVPVGPAFQRVYAAPIDYAAGALYPTPATKRLYLLVNVPPSAPATGSFTVVVSREEAAPPAPTLTLLSPASGSALGGDRIEIYGTHLQTTRRVAFGAAPAERWAVDDDGHIWATPPAGTGPADVRVTTLGGTATAAFTYVPGLPVVESLSPSAGPDSGNTEVTVSGRGLDSVVTAWFGNVAEPAAPQSGTEAITYSGAGQGAVHVRVGDGNVVSQESANDLFSYAGPVITSLDPAEGDEAGGTLVTINGTGLTGATEVTFGGFPASDLVGVSDTVLTVRSPSGRGRPDVLVTAQGLTSLPGTGDLFFFDGPTLQSASPPSGPDTGFTTVTLTGTRLDHVENVLFGGVAVPFTPLSPTSVTAVVPPGSGGTMISVRSRYGSTSNELHYGYEPTPAITGIAPGSGPQAGQTAVVISGRDLMAGIFRRYDNIWFGDLFGFVSSYTDTQITVDTPEGTGRVDILADDGTSKRVIGQFTYAAPSPLTVTGVSPVTGPGVGGTEVIVTGTGLSNVMTLCFGTSFVAFTVLSDTEIRAITPPGRGSVSVQATAWSTLDTNPPGPGSEFTYA